MDKVNLDQSIGPAQQAESLYVTHRPMIRNAINLLGMRRPVAPDVEQVIDDLEKMLQGMPTPAARLTTEWLAVAAAAEQQPIYQIRPRENVRDWCDVNVDGYRAAQAMASMETRKLYVAPVAQPAQTELMKALSDAAQSLESISNGAGRDEFMRDLDDVRGYARSRSSVARAALAAQGGRAK